MAASAIGPTSKTALAVQKCVRCIFGRLYLLALRCRFHALDFEWAVARALVRDV